MLAAEAVPPGARVVHIGPFKTGSTAVQWALHESRTELERHGCTYVAERRHGAGAARGITENLLPGMHRAGAERRWETVVERMTASDELRKVFSSEFLCNATGAQIARLVDDLGKEETYVVVTLRPLGAILPSQYQQYLQGGRALVYHRWLESVLDPDADSLTPSFWQRHRHDELVNAWAAAVGADHVVVVVMDHRDFGFGLRAFESLLDLPEGTLADKDVPANRSLTWPEAELLRQFNKGVRDSALSERLRRKLTLHALRLVKERVPPAEEPRIGVPAWAVRRANDLGADMAASIGASGVRVVGDLGLLSTYSSERGDERPPDLVDASVAATFATSLALAAQHRLDEVDATQA